MAQITPFKFEKHDKYYFDTYYFHCIDCGAEFTRHRWDGRTKPYCSTCTRKYETIKAKERAIRKEKAIRKKAISEMHDKLITHFAEWQSEEGCIDTKCILSVVCEDIDEIAEQLKEE